MPVTVKRSKPAPPLPPPSEIAAGTQGDAWNGNVVVFRHVHSYTATPRPALEVLTQLHDGGRGRGCLAHLEAPEARELAAALLEWADAVEAQA